MGFYSRKEILAQCNKIYHTVNRRATSILLANSPPVMRPAYGPGSSDIFPTSAITDGARRETEKARYMREKCPGGLAVEVVPLVLEDGASRQKCNCASHPNVLKTIERIERQVEKGMRSKCRSATQMCSRGRHQAFFVTTQLAFLTSTRQGP